MENFDETAFPTDADTGMTLRDYFAAKAMQGLLVTNDEISDEVRFARYCYKMADAMITARAE